MTQENTFDWDEACAEEERIQLSFEEENPIYCMFESSTPQVYDTKYKTPLYVFPVMTPDGDKAKFMTMSKRCMSGLQKYLPLEGKQFSIKKEGQGMDTTYDVVLITE